MTGDTGNGKISSYVLVIGLNVNNSASHTISRFQYRDIPALLNKRTGCTQSSDSCSYNADSGSIERATSHAKTQNLLQCFEQLHFECQSSKEGFDVAEGFSRNGKAS
jgi:hypothetical protein